MATLTARQFASASGKHFIAASNTPFDCGDTNTYLCAWVYYDSLPASNTTQVIMAKWNDSFSSTRDYIFGLRNTAGTIRFRWLVKDGSGVVFANTFGTPSTGTWYFIQCYHDATNNQMGISVNNGTMDTQSYSGGSTAGNTAFRIGALLTSGSAPAGFHNGRMAGIGFWQGSIPDSTIRAALYNNGNGKRYQDLTASQKTNLISYWDGSEASGNLIDGNGANNMTDVNGVGSAAGIITYSESTFRRTLSLLGTRAGSRQLHRR